MRFFDPLFGELERIGQRRWAEQLRELLPQKLAPQRHRELTSWQQALDELPELRPSGIELEEEVAIGDGSELDAAGRAELIATLQTFHPWRKGPYRLFGVEIDTEWRSDWKWQRLLPHIQPLAGRRVLDVGCGNGYHGWRMRGAGADFVLGIDPTLLSVIQFRVLQRYLNDPRHQLLPLGIEELPAELGCFDSVFSMGVLYHRRSPLDHLLELKGCLRPGGELILETLIVAGEQERVFMPQGRYAKMRNVWFLPCVETMCLWLRRCGFKDVSCVDINRTSNGEQRRTDWMRFESLADYLDPQDPGKTVEGHPAPLRALFVATRP